MIYIQTTITNSDLELYMSNNTREDRESQQYEVPTCEHYLNSSASSNDECEVRERERSIDENKVLALRICNSMIVFMPVFTWMKYAEHNHRCHLSRFQELNLSCTLNGTFLIGMMWAFHIPWM